MTLTSAQAIDFQILSQKLADVVKEPGEQTLDNLQNLLLLARDEFEDEEQIFKLLNDYAFEPVTDITRGITRASRRVCKIVNQGGPSTGTLVGPDLVLAARHALRGNGTFAHPDQLQVIFDEYCFMDGREHRLERRVARTADGSRLHVAASSVELDYVIFHLESAIGLDRLGTSPRKRRGWMDLSTVEVAPEGQVIILQHPEGRLLKVSDGHVNPDRTGVSPGRFRYDTVADPGSSGAPVLNQARQLVGMHVKEVGQIEELISLTAIFADLAEKQIRLPRYPPPRESTENFLGMLLEPQSEVAFL